MYIDTHSHLNFKAFEKDFDTVIKRALDSGVERIIIPGSNLETSQKAVKIAEKYPYVFAAIGLHPIHVKDEEFDEKFAKLAENPKVVAIGETGLDYFYDKSLEDKQKEVFIKHLQLANKVGKSVILHNRDAGEDLLSILTSQNPLPKIVMHCFSESSQYAQIILDMGLHISFTGIITFTKNYGILEAIKNTPLDKIMIETDSPFLTPDPYRGQRNEPSLVIEIAKKIAEIKKISIEKVAEQTSKTAVKFFNLN